jgi:hypothetical protein
MAQNYELLCEHLNLEGFGFARIEAFKHSLCMYVCVIVQLAPVTVLLSCDLLIVPPFSSY